MSTLIEIARRVKSESGRSGTGPVSVAAAGDDDRRILNAVRDAWQALQLEAFWWRWMRKSMAAGALAAGQVANTVAALGLTDHGEWWPESSDYWPTAYDVNDASNEWRLRELSYDRFRARFMVGTHDAAQPQFYAIAPNGDLLVGPKPDSANYRVRMDYKAAPTSLLVDADAPDMPSQHHDVLIWLALMPIAAADAAPEHYTRGRDKSDDLLSKLIDSQAEKMRITARPLA